MITLSRSNQLLRFDLVNGNVYNKLNLTSSHSSEIKIDSLSYNCTCDQLILKSTKIPIVSLFL